MTEDDIMLELGLFTAGHPNTLKGIEKERKRVIHALNTFLNELIDDEDGDALAVLQCIEVITYGHVLEPVFPGTDWPTTHMHIDLEEYGKGWRMGRWVARQELINRFRDMPNSQAMTPAQVIHHIRPAEDTQ